MQTRKAFLLIAVLLTAAASQAQEKLRGHWTGAVQLPGQSLAMEVDLDKTAGNTWAGSISIPAQNASGIPVDSISFADGKCSFRIKGVPGDPTFNGTIAADGKTMSGEFTQGGGTFPFKFTLAGDPKVSMEKASPPVAKEFLGNWEGAIEAGQTLRVVLKLSNTETSSTAVLVTVDQGGTEIPVSAIDQKGAKLKLSIKMIGGTYDADINKDASELNGTWSQNGNDIPLKLKKTPVK